MPLDALTTILNAREVAASAMPSVIALTLNDSVLSVGKSPDTSAISEATLITPADERLKSESKSDVVYVTAPVEDVADRVTIFPDDTLS